MLFSIITIGVTTFFACCLIKQSFNIETTDWLSAILSWLSVASAIFIGLIAFWQNERFKNENDKSARKLEDHQRDLLEINNRLMKIEENKECAQIAFIQEAVTVANSEEFQSGSKRKQYSAGITDSGRTFANSTVFSLGITNQTNTPIRYFELKKFKVSYYDQNTGIDTTIKDYPKGGFVPSPIIDRGEAVNYILIANNLHDLAEKLPPDNEINIVIVIEVTSIFNRTVEQKFLLRLQKNNTLFHSNGNKNIFWNYCYESDSHIIPKSDKEEQNASN